MVGLKSDLRRNRNAIGLLKAQGLVPVTYQQAIAVANEIKSQYVECSSKENVGVKEVFNLAISLAISNNRFRKLRKSICQIL